MYVPLRYSYYLYRGNTNVSYTDQAVQEIKEMGRRLKAFKMDVTNKKQVQEVIAQLKDEFGRIDILINNTGILGHVSQIKHQKYGFGRRTT